MARCENLDSITNYDPKAVAQTAWEVLIEGDTFLEGKFNFAHQGTPATLKIDAERLSLDHRAYAVMVGLVATHPCIQQADVLTYVPDGHTQFTIDVGRILNKRVANVRRIEGGGRRDFAFVSDYDEALALSARHLVINEDISSTLGSVAAVRGLLPPRQNVHSLSLLLRGAVFPDFAKGLTPHFLVERLVPVDADDFRRKFPDIEPSWL